MTKFQAFLKQIGSNLRQLRVRFGLTQVEASKKAGIPERRYQDIESGKANMTLRSLFRLSHLYKVKPKQLL